MFNSTNLSVNEKGNLVIGGVDTADLVRDYKTPLYVYDEDLIRETCRSYKKSLEKYYNSNGQVCYASKAFSCKEMCRIIMDEGLGLDVVSAGEFYTAISAGYPAKDICFHGNNKTEEELMFAIRHGVGRIIVDNIIELHKLNELAKKSLNKIGILFRIKPGIDAHTHDFVKTGQIDSKFGFALETGEAFEAVKEALTCENLEFKGIHCHIGSQIFDVEPFTHAANVMLDFIKKIKDELNYEIDELDLGGGFGIKYIDEDNPLPYEKYMEAVLTTVKDTCHKLALKEPFISFEPGRSIVGEAGITLYKVGSIKTIPNIRTYVAIDGGMTDNPRYALYQSKYDMLIANKADQPKDFVATIAGKCCESGDLIGENVKIQTPEVDDTLAVLSTGAYNYSMASNYNRIAKPAAVTVKNGKSKIIIKRESIEDLVKNDI